MGKHTYIELTAEQRTELEKWIRTGDVPARTNTRARILLLSDCSQGQNARIRKLPMPSCAAKAPRQRAPTFSQRRLSVRLVR